MVIEAFVKTKRGFDVLAFLVGSGDTYCTCATNFRNLTHYGAHCSGSRRHHEGFSRLGFADVFQSCVSRHPGHSQYSKGE